MHKRPDTIIDIEWLELGWRLELGGDLVFTRYSHFEALCTNQPSLYSLRPPALTTLLQYYCTTIGQYTSPFPNPLLYSIHRTILVVRISCKGQFVTWAEDRASCRGAPLYLRVHETRANNVYHYYYSCGAFRLLFHMSAFIDRYHVQWMPL